MNNIDNCPTCGNHPTLRTKFKSDGTYVAWIECITCRIHDLAVRELEAAAVDAVTSAWNERI